MNNGKISDAICHPRASKMNYSLFTVFHGNLQNRRQKIFNKGHYVCAGGLDIQNFDKNCRFLVLAISWGGLKFCLGGLVHKRPLVGTGMELCSGTKMFFDE